MQESLDRHVSSIQQAAKETERSNEELILATQMAEEASKQKTAFIQNMTHQIRTPLNIISGFAQVLRDTLSLTNGSNLSDQVLPEDEFAKITDAMRHNSRTLNRMVLMLFDSSDTGIINELNTHKSDIVKCNDMAKKCIDITYSQFHEVVIRFETNVPDDFCIQTNELYLMRSICELLYNASKYSDGKNIIVRIQQNQEKVCFIIEDVGPGIAEDYRELMFKSFTKINDLSEGLGLGLPLSKQHAVSLGGNLTYDASYDKGCRFIIELPLVHQEVQA
jgi:signal transduction histidine kinase